MSQKAPVRRIKKSSTRSNKRNGTKPKKSLQEKINEAGYDPLASMDDIIGDYEDDNVTTQLELPDMMNDSPSSAETTGDFTVVKLSKTPQTQVITPFFNEVELKLYSQILENGVSINHGLQYCFKFISMVLDSYTLNSMKINRDIIENDILSILNRVSITTEPFWRELANTKDIISYKLGSRNFPTYKLVVKEEKVDVTDGKPADSKPTSTTTKVGPPPKKNPEPGDNPPAVTTDADTAPVEPSQLQQIQKKYDLGRRPGLQKTLDQDYIDEGITIKENGIRLYNTLIPSEYYSITSQDTIDSIFTICKKQKFYTIMLSLFCRLVSSRELCHLVFQSKVVMSTMFDQGKEASDGSASSPNPFLDEKYQEIIHYYFFYGMYILYKEECIVKTRAKLDHRFVLDLETVQKIPIYDGPLNDNPFVPMTLSSDYLYAQHVKTADYIFKPVRAANSERGLYTLQSVQDRFEIFTHGMFKGLNWDKLSATGSVIPATVIRNPLERLFNINLPSATDLNDPAAAHQYWATKKSDLLNYFDEYYPSKNILSDRYFDRDDKTMCEELALAGESATDIDIIVDVNDDADFDREVNRVFDIVQANLKMMCKTDPARYQDDRLKLLQIKSENSYKYYIVGPALPKNIELFRIFTSPVGCVSRFHFPCVRGVYQGTSVKIFPSLLSAAYTGMFVDYKWMSSAKNTKDLVCKYYTRGFTPILSAPEHESLTEHVKNPESDWGYLQQANNNSRSVSSVNPIFKPRMYRTGIYADFREYDMKPPPTHQFTTPTMSNFDEYWEPQDKISTYKFPLQLRFKAGHIQPPELWKMMPYLTALARSGTY